MKIPKAAMEYFKEQGRKGGLKGGSKGGKAAAAGMTKEQRIARAKKAVAARKKKANKP